VLRSVGAWILSIALVLLSSDAFRQALNEFRDTEPGSLLFGALQLVIGTSAAVASVGVFKRARWAARSIGVGGIAAVGLLVAQPLFEPMTSHAQWSIWFGAAVVGAAAAGAGWYARRLARQAAASRASETPARVVQPSPALLPDAQPIIAPAPHAHVARGASTHRHDDPQQASGTPLEE
jgi:peptidoglycan/LPS O-acetylase OafA/YrhL